MFEDCSTFESSTGGFSCFHVGSWIRACLFLSVDSVVFLCSFPYIFMHNNTLLSFLFVIMVGLDFGVIWLSILSIFDREIFKFLEQSCWDWVGLPIIRRFHRITIVFSLSMLHNFFAHIP